MNQSQPRSLEELLQTDQPAWSAVQSWISESVNGVDVVSPNLIKRDEILLSLQVSLRAPMGAIVYETGGLRVDDGWIRVLGSGGDRLPRNLLDWNLRCEWPEELRVGEGMWFVADDAIGGVFAVNNGAFPAPIGTAFYLAPDNTAWECVAESYSHLLQVLFNMHLDRFYHGRRWSNWRLDTAKLHGDKAFSIVPFLWADGPPVDDRSRQPISAWECIACHLDIVRQMNGGTCLLVQEPN